MKKALIIYIGNGYSPLEYSDDKSYTYSTDMRENFLNHKEKIFDPLNELGYDYDFMLLTNKHEKYDEFAEYYNAINVEYDDITSEDMELLKKYYFSRSNVPPGSFRSGGRFLKIKNNIPEYDIYVIIRADIFFKVELSQLRVDFEKMNWLWPETDYRIFLEEEKDFILKEYGSEMFAWNLHKRVTGNTFNVIPKKFFNVFKNFIWMEHVSFFMMVKELSPFISYDDINLMLGFDKCYVTDLRFCDNPVYGMNKKIIGNFANIETKRFGKP